MLGLDRGIAAGFYRRNERIGMPIVTVPGRRRQLRQEPTISVVCRAAHGFSRSTTMKTKKAILYIDVDDTLIACDRDSVGLDGYNLRQRVVSRLRELTKH